MILIDSRYAKPSIYRGPGIGKVWDQYNSLGLPNERGELFRRNSVSGGFHRSGVLNLETTLRKEKQRKERNVLGHIKQVTVII